MEEARALVRDLVRWGRPALLPRFLSAFSLSLDALILVLPLGALVYRLRHGIPRDPASLATGLAPWLLVVPAAALVRALLGRSDPMTCARAADRASAGEDRFLTAADAELHRRASPLLPLLVGSLRPRLARLPRPRGADVGGRRPHLGLVGLALLFALALLFVPAAGRGLLGAPDPNRRGAGAALVGEEGSGEGEGAASADEFGAKVTLEASTDARVYALGQEINLTLSLRVDEPLPAGVALAVVLRLDGAKRLPLDIEWELPSEPGEELTATVPLRDRLREIEAYGRGLLTIESFAFPREEREDLRGAAEANRVIVQISENQKDLQARAPRSAKKEKKPQRKPRPQKDRKERPDESVKKKRRPDPEERGPERGGPPPPEEIEAKKSVVEPLFTGDQTKKRRKRVYDRGLEAADPKDPPPAPQADRDRAYQAEKELEILKGTVPPRDRARVKRYFDRVRPGSRDG